MLLALGMRLSSHLAQRNVNTVTTNVPGPQVPLYVCGRRMLKAYPYVPLAGQVRIGVAIFSYNGEVNFGVTGDYDTTADIDVLCRGIEDGVKQLLKAGDRAGVGSAVADVRSWRNLGSPSGPLRGTDVADP
jgi:hypothetical protein